LIKFIFYFFVSQRAETVKEGIIVLVKLSSIGFIHANILLVIACFFIQKFKAKMKREVELLKEALKKINILFQ
jgi:hypothetical protein